MYNQVSSLLCASALLNAAICLNQASAANSCIVQDPGKQRQDEKATDALQGFRTKDVQSVSIRGSKIRSGELSAEKIVSAFGRQGFRINEAEVADIRANVQLAVSEARAHGIGNSKVDFAAVEIARDLSVGTDNATIRRIVAVIGELSGLPETILRPSPRPLPIIRTPCPLPGKPFPTPGKPCPLPIVTPAPLPRPLPIRNPRAPISPGGETGWENYFDQTVNLWNQPNFMNLMSQNGFSPVKISWEDIGRYQNSVWGDRISDVGIWVRRYEKDALSARLALSVRRDSNFRDNVLMVPAEKIKVHIKQGDRTIEKTLPHRLAELGLSSPSRDKNVIVSNQFAIVPVPARDMIGSWPKNTPPRAAFNFSIYPYGSTNFVITDVIEGSSEAIVGPGAHQLLYADIGGQKAPFTASRAEDRQDLLKLERELKSKGMDVDVQRYYLIQVPLRRDADNIALSNMGTPPRERASKFSIAEETKAKKEVGASKNKAKKKVGASKNVDSNIEYLDDVTLHVMPKRGVFETSKAGERIEKENEPGLERVAIGYGEAEGPYFTGSGYQGARADEPIRVTVVYFVTPKGKVAEEDMRNFAETFSRWDAQAIWGGSFVTKE
ncbi:MAG: hypothetical protein LBQ86_01305 [Holophagales bacterium]|jgi:hypothetical protein|nr:hypothetical protein [Holophagales bacterium]